MESQVEHAGETANNTKAVSLSAVIWDAPDFELDGASSNGNGSGTDRRIFDPVGHGSSDDRAAIATALAAAARARYTQNNVKHAGQTCID